MDGNSTHHRAVAGFLEEMPLGRLFLPRRALDRVYLDTQMTRVRLQLGDTGGYVPLWKFVTCDQQRAGKVANRVIGCVGKGRPVGALQRGTFDLCSELVRIERGVRARQ